MSLSGRLLPFTAQQSFRNEAFMAWSFKWTGQSQVLWHFVKENTICLPAGSLMLNLCATQTKKQQADTTAAAGDSETLQKSSNLTEPVL